MFGFRKIWCALFSSYLRFEIHPFALSPTYYEVLRPVSSHYVHSRVCFVTDKQINNDLKNQSI